VVFGSVSKLSLLQGINDVRSDFGGCRGSRF
jgi:hypothetical protein